jgi:hypothetical protein
MAAAALGMPAVTRRALGLAPEAAGSGSSDQAGGGSVDIAGVSLRDAQPLLRNLSKVTVVPVLSALRGILHGYVEADQLMGPSALPAR